MTAARTSGSPPRGIVVTGASRGIGRAVAEALAGPATSLLLVGRDAALLEETAAGCRRAGADATVLRCDVRDRDDLAAALLRFDAARPVDLVVANAGVALPTDDDAAAARASYGEIEINYVGALNTVLPLLPRMTARGHGQVAFVSSIAALTPLPDSPGYCGSKAALLMYGLALRERMRGRGVRVSVVLPGYIDTEMGERYRGWRPLAMSPRRAAARILDGLARDRAVVAFPRRLALVAKLSTFVPETVRRLGMGGFRFRIDET